MLVGFSDTFLTGQVLPQFLPQGVEAHLAAVSSMTYLLWFVTELFVFIAMGSTAVIARFVGAGQFAEARWACNQSVLLGAVAAVVLTAVVLMAGGWLVWLVQLKGEAADLALRYLYWVFPVLPGIMLQAIGVACLRGVGDTRGGLWIMLVVVVVNLVVSWALVVGLGPIPQMGWDGIALGTACGELAGGLLAVVFLVVGRSGLGLSWKLLRPHGPLCRRLLRIGIPGGTDMMLIILCQFWFLALVNGLTDPSSGPAGQLPAAAHGVALRVESLAYLPATAFQVAAATLVGQALGAGNRRRARRVVHCALTVGLIFVGLMGLAFYFAGPQLAGLFVSSDQTEVRATSGQLLRIVAFAMPGLGLTMILNGALRGAGDTRWPVLFNLLGFLAVRLPLTFLMAYHWEWGIVGAWYAMQIDLNTRCLLSLGRFWQGGWQRVRV